MNRSARPGACSERVLGYIGMKNQQLMDVALGERPADAVISGTRLLDVYSGRLVPERSLAVCQGFIAALGPDPTPWVGPDTQVIQAEGRIMCPGYLDCHTHLGNYFDVADFLRHSIPGGTTSHFSEAESYAFALGVEGFRAFLDQTADRPVNFFLMIPPMVTRSPATRRFIITADQARELLALDGVMGLGEPYWQGALIPPDPRVLELMALTVEAGKSVEGHAAGARGGRLAAYTLAGASSCHEAVSPEDVLERLEMGLYAMIREGDIRRDLDILVPLKDRIDFRRLILITDGTNPEILVERGYLVDVVQKALDLGIPLINAVRMVTLNPAEHFGLERRLGGLAPGRQADVLLLPDESTAHPDLVMAKGQVVAQGGELSIDVPRRPYPAEVRRTVRLDPVSEQDFAVPAPREGDRVIVRIMDVHSGGLVTREAEAEVSVAGGRCLADPDSDLLKVAFFERATGQGRRFVGFARGWGLKRGAMASSVTWDALGVSAVGADDRDLAAAVNRVIEMQGGSVAVLDGEILEEIPFPVVGYVSDLPVEEVAERMRAFQAAAASLGCILPYAHLTLNVASATAIPFVRLTEEGYYRFRQGDVKGL